MDKDEMNCKSKRKYPNKRKALLAVFFAPSIVPLAPYKCPVCRKWHLTKNPSQVKKWDKKWDMKILVKRAKP